MDDKVKTFDVTLPGEWDASRKTRVVLESHYDSLRARVKELTT